MFGKALKRILGTKHDREIKKIRPTVDAINQLEAKMKKLSDDDLRGKTAEFKQKLDNGASLDDLLIPAFATVREAGRRVLGMRHYDVQMIGGMVLHQGRIAEMRTGEGKTLVATLPCYLNALSGKGVHVVTVNDYLASRDAEWMGRLHSWMGLSTGVVVPQMPNAHKKVAYACDITYGQNNEFGFDYMRDNMKFSIHEYVQRELNFAIVDEVDSILIDEARTPLIISGPGETASASYVKINDLIPRLRREEHYEVDEKARQVTLTEEGIERAQQMLGDAGLLSNGNLYDPTNIETLHILSQCLRANVLYLRDKDYMVGGDGKILIIDEHTGRALPGRRWSDGLHQAVEAKERVPIQDENITLATISFQNLFRLYDKLSGMTGTADTEATEFHKIYELDVVVIPTNKPIARVDNEDLVYKSEREKFRAVVGEIESAIERGQPVLVGTASVEKSDAVSRALSKREIPHNVLNAKQHELEAYVVAQAGVPGTVTVATNMAGRGTDIILGGNPEMLARMSVMQEASPEELKDDTLINAMTEEAVPMFEEKCKAQHKAVIDAGGLFIVGTERHESRRIDNQLRGRAGRQGDPGESRFFLSLEDDLMRIFAGDKVQTMMDRMGMEEDEPIEHKWVTKAVENAQKKVEERNFDIRKNLLEYDDVMNQQRKSIYELRRQVLQGKYRTVPTEDEKKKGKKPESLVSEIFQPLLDKAKPILEQMVKLHATPMPEHEVTQAELDALRDKALAQDIGALTELRTEPVEKDVYEWFGCPVDLRKFKSDPRGALSFLNKEVGMSLTEQRERLLDTVDAMVGGLVERTCPPNRHHEDWDIDTLCDEFETNFGIEATGVEGIGSPDEMAAKLYIDAESVLKNKEEDFGSLHFLRLFRNFYLQEIDKQWIENLQAMQTLRDGIGLVGYGQRDPKKEYKRIGFDMFQAMMDSIQARVVNSVFSVQRVREEDLEALEAERRQAVEERQQQMAASHAAQSAQEGEAGGAIPQARQGGGQAQQRGRAQAPTGENGQPLNRAQRRALAKKQRKNAR